MEYKKSLEDEIDWKIIDQLHAATISFTTTSLELKKIYFTLITIAVPTVIKLSGDTLKTSLFVTIIILTITFWYLDGFTNYFQEKLRESMDKRFDEIRTRNNSSVEDIENQEDTLENSRKKGGRLKRSIIGRAVIVYPIFLFMTLVIFSLFRCGVIQTITK
jgi:hypothetical protein